MREKPIIVWLRRDLRLGDHPALAKAAASGRPVLPVFIGDDGVMALGAAAKWRLGLGLAQFDAALRGIGSRITFRRGDALGVLRALIAQTGADTVFWSRLYDPEAIARDTAVKAGLRDDGVTVESFNAHLLYEPWTVSTKQGGYYKVYTPFWRMVKDLPVAHPVRAVDALGAPADWPESERLEDWRLGDAMQRGADIVARHVRVGEEAAQDRLAEFLEDRVDGYRTKRDFPGVEATSGLSENLTYGEISPRVIWFAAQQALSEGRAGAEHFAKELVWREFAYHLIYHTPKITTQSWRDGWEGFGWRGDNEDAERWRRGQTGVPFVDAAMREMYVTGVMHNRARMIVGSYLTKHLLTDWRVGQAWFEQCLADWDPASNAMGWQWVAGSGPDASPYFRIFNPEGQAAKFDPDGVYQNRWIAEGQAAPGRDALDFFLAVPKSWDLSPKMAYATPVIGLKEGRERALEAYQNRGF